MVTARGHNSDEVPRGSAYFRLHRFEVWIVLVYLAFGLAWIFFSDALLLTFASGDHAWRLQTYKGWAYVGITALGLYLLLRRSSYRLERAYAKLRQSGRRLQFLYNANPSILVSLDAAGRVLTINQDGARHLGHAPEALVGQPYAELIHRDDRAIAERAMRITRDEAPAIQKWEVRMAHASGHPIWTRQTSRSVRDRGHDEAFLLVCEDIEQTHALQLELEYHSTHDTVTELLNRREFERRLTHRARERTDKPHVLCVVDVDHFGVINTTCGHAQGDAVLRELARLLAGEFRRGDDISRIGGDEFAVVIEHCAVADALAMAEALRSRIAAHAFGAGGRSLSLTVSIGLVVMEEAGQSAGTLMAMADSACRAAKQAGRNRVSLYDESGTRAGAAIMQEMEIATWIAEALAGDLLYLVAQEIRGVRGDVPPASYFEVLVRASPREGDPVPPGLLLRVAETYGLAPRLDRWIVDHAIAWLEAQAADGRPLPRLSLNLSGQSLGDGELTDWLVERIAGAAVPADRLNLEITETAAISNPAVAQNFMQVLRASGVTFALDDFGSGMSSFGHLAGLAVDQVKIDGSFVRNLAEDAASEAIVRAVTDIAHSLDKQVVAEWVESGEILARLEAIGVDFAQGYHVHRPQPLSELPGYLRSAGT